MVKESDNKRLAKNTLILYTRTFFMMIISLFTVRVVFNVLGADDYGIHSVVAGFVTMFIFITSSLSVTISRFMSIALGSGKENTISSIFSTAIIILTAIAAIIVVAVECIGIPFLNTKMNIPQDRIVAANWVLQMAILTIFVNMLTIAYDALIISYEKMSAYAYVSIFDALLKLLLTYLVYISPADKLITYSVLLLIHAIVLRIVYGVYCHNKFQYCRFKLAIDKPLIKNILGITSWDLFGAASCTIQKYGLDLILNIFCGILVNAARGIANQVNSAVVRFSQGFLTAIRPQIYKAYASGDKNKLQLLVINGTRFAVYLLLIISLPIAFECDYLLKLWLGNIPDHSVNFVRLVLLLSICDGAMAYCPNAAIMATGRIRNCQVACSITQLMNIPLAYFLLYRGFTPEYVLIGSVLLSLAANILRVGFLNHLIQFPFWKFIIDVCAKLIAVTVASAILPFILHNYVEQQTFFTFIINIIVAIISTSLAIGYLGCKKAERDIVISKIKSTIIKRV